MKHIKKVKKNKTKKEQKNIQIVPKAYDQATHRNIID